MKLVKLILCLILVACFAVPAMAENNDISEFGKVQYEKKGSKFLNFVKSIPKRIEQNVNATADCKNYCEEMTSPNTAKIQQYKKFKPQIKRAIELSEKNKDGYYDMFNDSFKYADKSYRKRMYSEWMNDLFDEPESFRDYCSDKGATTRFASGLSSVLPGFINAIAGGKTYPMPK